jgi:hypothetical protein
MVPENRIIYPNKSSEKNNPSAISVSIVPISSDFQKRSGRLEFQRNEGEQEEKRQPQRGCGRSIPDSFDCGIVAMENDRRKAIWRSPIVRTRLDKSGKEIGNNMWVMANANTRRDLTP